MCKTMQFSNCFIIYTLLSNATLNEMDVVLYQNYV